MTKEQAIEALKEHKRQIDKKYINTRNSKAIETVLSMLEEKDKVIDLMAEILVKVPENNFIAKYLNQDLEEKKKEIKRYFENKAKELLNK